MTDVHAGSIRRQVVRMCLLLLLVISIPEVGLSAQYEELPLDARIEGQFAVEDRDHLYRVTLPSPGALRICVDGEQSLGLRVYLMDSGGRRTIASDSAGSLASRSVSGPNLSAGSYFVRVLRASGHGQYTVEPKLTPQTIPDSPRTHDTIDRALALTIGESTTALLGYYAGGTTDTEDWYQVRITQPGHLWLSVEGEDTLNFRIYLLDTNGVRTLGSDSAGASTLRTIIRPDLYPGTYYLRVLRSSGYGGYTLTSRFTPQTIPDVPQRSDSLAQAYPLPVNEAFTGLLGYLVDGQADGQDWYQVTITEPGALRFSIEAEKSLHIRAYLLDDTGTTSLHTDSSGSSSSRRVQREDLQPGTYYLRVVRSGGYGGYWMEPLFVPHPMQRAGSEASVPLNQPVFHRLAFVGEYPESWHRLALAEPGPLLVHAVAEEPLTMRLRLHDADGVTQLLSDTGGALLSRMVSLEAEATEYLLRLERMVGHGVYSLLVADEQFGVAANPASYDFGSVRVGTRSRAMRFGAVNLSDEPAVWHDAAVVGDSAAQFAVVSSIGEDGLIGPRSAVHVDVVFEPTLLGKHQAELVVSTDQGSLTIPLQGAGFSMCPSILFDSPWAGMWRTGTGAVLHLQQQGQRLSGYLVRSTGTVSVIGEVYQERAVLDVVYDHREVLGEFVPPFVAEHIMGITSELVLEPDGVGGLEGEYQPWLVWFNQLGVVKDYYHGREEAAKEAVSSQRFLFRRP